MNVTTTRKIISGAVLLITGIVITYWKGDIPSNMKELMENLYYGFVAGNAFEHFTTMKLNQTDNKKVVNE
jgi:hypothetical protein